MLDFIKTELKKFNIDLVSCLHLDECEIKRAYLLEKNGIENGSVIIFAVPYLSEVAFEGRNVSSYAVSPDYHAFFSALFESIIPTLKERFPNNKFAGFTDHSPINEIKASANAGLGVIGTNNLLLTEKYSSYVFIGEIITDAILPSFFTEIKHCIDCKKCLSACPVGADIDRCLSSLTQKKGNLTDEEKALIKEQKCAWGCDICQEVCPYTQKVFKNGTIFTNIDFFNNNLTPLLTSEDIEKMNENDFKARAYSWRGKQVILRNLKILEEKES